MYTKHLSSLNKFYIKSLEQMPENFSFLVWYQIESAKLIVSAEFRYFTPVCVGGGEGGINTVENSKFYGERETIKV